MSRDENFRYDIHIGIYRLWPDISAYEEGALRAGMYLEMMMNGYHYKSDCAEIKEHALIRYALMKKAESKNNSEEVAYWRGYLSRFD